MSSRVSPGWKELRVAYPRVVAGMALVLALLLLGDLVLVSERVRYGRALVRMSASLLETERQRVDAIAASEESGLALAVELSRREALDDTELHLAVDVRRSILYLERQGERLREMPVQMGRAAIVGSPPDTVVLAPPLGKRSIARVVDGSYTWTVPEWVYDDDGGSEVPTERRIPGALGPTAIFLDSGAVLYALPAVGPLSEASYVLPGSVRLETPDIEAIRDVLTPGMAVYFH